MSRFTTAIGPFAIVPRWMIDALPGGRDRANAVLVWCRLWDHADRASGECWPSRDTLADECGFSRATVGRATALLEQTGALERVGQATHADSGKWGSQRYLLRVDPPPAAP